MSGPGRKFGAVLTTLVVGLAVLVTPGSATAAPLSLDPGFGSGGVTGQLLLPGSRFGSVTATIAQPDGKVLLVGRAYGSPASTYQRGAVIRLNANGTLDGSFGAGGRVFLPDGFNCASCNEAALNAIAIDSAGRILLAGQGKVGGVTSATAVRLTPTGALDSGFGGTGMVRVGGSDSHGIGIAADSQDGVLIATASGFPFFESSPGVTRLTPAGVVDGGFGSGGTTSLAAGGVIAAAVTPVDLARLPSGFAVIGTTQEFTASTTGGLTSTRAAAVVRVSAGGTVSSFTRIRPAGTPVPEGSFYPDALAVSGGATAAGTVYLSGLSELKRDKGGGGIEYDYSASGTGIFAAAVPAAGSPEIAFVPGTTGSSAVAGDIAADGADGFAVVAAVGAKYEIAGFGPSLSLDPDYGQQGVLAFPGFGQPSTDVASSLTFDVQHRLVVSGSSANGGGGGSDFGALRLTGEATPPVEKAGETGGGAPSGSSTPAATAKPKANEKTLKCRKGFKKKTVRGKAKCVKKKRPNKHHRSRH